MSKTITSPVKRWPGTVTISDPLDIPQYLALEQMFRARAELSDSPTWGEVQAVIVPAVLPCIEQCNLPEQVKTMFEQGKFPMTPRAASIALMGWLIGEITALFNEAEEAPNA